MSVSVSNNDETPHARGTQLGAFGAVGPESPESIRAELSDARRSILHRQERDALAILSAKREGGGDVTLAQAQDALLLRADLMELALLKQSRALASAREALQQQSKDVERIGASLSNAPGGRSDDRRHVDNLDARLDAVEQWILRVAPSAKVV